LIKVEREVLGLILSNKLWKNVAEKPWLGEWKEKGGMQE